MAVTVMTSDHVGGEGDKDDTVSGWTLPRQLPTIVKRLI